MKHSYPATPLVAPATPLVAPATPLVALLALLAGCGTAQPAPAPAPRMSAMAAPSAAPITSASAAAPTTPAAIAPASAAPREPPGVIIHTADLYGQLLGRQGATFTIASLLVTSQTRPAAGMKATLWVRPEGSTDDSAWVQIAEAVVKTPLDASQKLQIKITSDEKKLSGPGGAKPAALVKGARVKITWEW